MSDVRLLHRQVDGPVRVQLLGAPRGQHKVAVQERNALCEYLDAALMRPLYFTPKQQDDRVEASVNSMTKAERIFLEIEMRERSRSVHSFDYDALR